MIPKSVKYGRTIEVGGPFGQRPVERVWFGWWMELEDGETEPEALETLRALANLREREERDLYYKRKYNYREEIELARKAKGSYVIRKSNVESSHSEYLMHSSREKIAWGRYESAFVSTSLEDAKAYAERRGLTDKDYEVVPGPSRPHTSLSHKHEEQDPVKDREGT